MAAFRLAAVSAFAALTALSQTTYAPGRIFQVRINGEAASESGDIRIPVSIDNEGHRLSGSIAITLPATVPGGTLTAVAPGRNIINAGLTSQIAANVTWNYPAAPGGSFSASGSISQRPSEVAACASLLAPQTVESPASAGSRSLSLSRSCTYTSLGTGAETSDGVFGTIQTTVQITGGRATVSASVSVTYQWKPEAPTDNVSLEAPAPAPGTLLIENQPASFTARVRAQVGTLPGADLFLVLIDARGSRVAQTAGASLVRGPASTSTLTVDATALPQGDYSLVALLTEPGTTNIIKESSRIPYTVHRFRLTLGFQSSEGFVPRLPELRAGVLEGAAGAAVSALVETSLPVGDHAVEILGTVVELNGRTAVQAFSSARLDQFLAGPVDLAREIVAGYESVEFYAQTRVNLTGGGQSVVRSNRIKVDLDAIRIVNLSPRALTPVARGVENSFQVDLQFNVVTPSRLVVRVRDRSLSGGYQSTQLEVPGIGKRSAAYSFSLPPLLAAGEGAIEVDFALEATGGLFLDRIRATAGPVLFPFKDLMQLEGNELRGRGVSIGNLTAGGEVPPPSVSRSYQFPLALALLSQGLFNPYAPKDERSALAERDLSRMLPLAATWEFDPPRPASQLQGRLTLSYADLELPGEPGFAESRIEIVSVSDTGEATRWPTTVDSAGKTVSAEIRGLPRWWTLAAFGPFATRALATPASSRSWLLNLGASSVDGLAPRVLTPADPQAAVVRAGLRTVSGVSSISGESAGFETLAAEEPAAGPLLAPVVRSATSIHAVGPDSLAQELLFVLIGPDGLEFARRRESLQPLRRRSWTVAALFENVPADFIGSLWIHPSRRLSAAIIEAGEREVVAAPLLRPAAVRTEQYTSLAAAGSTLTLINANRAETARVNLRWRVPEGIERGAVTRSLAPGAMLREGIASLFGGSAATGSLSVEAASPLLFGWLEVQGGGATIVPLESPRRYSVAPLLAAPPGETSISIFNPAPTPVQVEIATRQDAAVLEARRFTIAAGAMLTEPIRQGNYALINSSAPVVPQLLLRQNNEIAFAAAQTPADGVEIPPALDAPAVTAPRISVSPSALDFGSLPTGQTRSLNLTVSNTGNGSLLITSAVFSNPAFSSAAAFPVTIPVGGLATIVIRFAPTAAGAVAARLDLTSNDQANPRVAVNLSGIGTVVPAVAPRIEPSTATVAFGIVAPLAQPTRPLQIRNTGNAVLTINSAAMSDPRFSLVGVAFPIAVQPLGSVSWTVRFAATSALGAVAATLTVFSDDPATPQLRVPLTATVAGTALAPRVAVSRTSVDFGTVSVGSQGEETIEIRNTGNIDLEVESIRTGTDRFRIPGSTSFRLPPGVVFDLRLLFIPASAIEEKATLRILSNDPASPTEVQLTGVGR